MKLIKLHIDNSSYVRLLKGQSVTAKCINDYISTTRHDRLSRSHVVEDRRTILTAFSFASKTRRLNVVSYICREPVVAKLEAVGNVSDDGMTFQVSLSAVTEKEEVA